MKYFSPLTALRMVTAALFLVFFSWNAAAHPDSAAATPETISQLGKNLKVGDIVFTHIRALPFEMVSRATRSWTNHVGIVIDISGDEPTIAESKFPFSSKTSLSRFVARSKDGRIAIARLNTPLTEEQERQILHVSSRRLGIFYDTGFNLHSNRQFCSKFVREVLADATGEELGDVETFQELLAANPNANLGFWKLWYFGNIPWQRQTVTPASLLRSTRLHKVFDGFVTLSTVVSKEHWD